MYEQITVKTLANQGEKKVSIAKTIGCHRNTVHNILKRDVIERQSRSKPSIFDQYHNQIKGWIDSGVTQLRIYEILKEEYGLEREYDTLCKYIQKHFPKHKNAYGVQIVEPGEVCEVDFGYLGMLPCPLGKPVKTFGLAVVLGYSRQGYWAVTYDQKLGTLVKELRKAFKFFGGIPKKLKVDNMKVAILKNLHYDLEFNQDFLEFASYYNSVIVPCTPYHPWQKGKVESAIKYLKNNFVNGRKFTNSHNLKTQLKDWVEKANLRVHGTTKKVPYLVFKDKEQDRLQPLPNEDFTYFNRAIRKVGRNCHINFQQNYYSVPDSLVGKEVIIRWNEYLLRVVYQGEQVALHKLNSSYGEHITVRAHMPSYKIYSQTEYQASYEDKMASIGSSAHKLFFLLVKRNNYWGRTVRGVLGLAQEYGKKKVEASITRALHFNSTDLTTLKNIITNRLYLLELEPRLPKSEDSSLSRDLSYYTVE